MSDWPQPAYLIRTPRLALRCYERTDVDAVHAAVCENLEALRPVMPWIAYEPKTRDERAADIRRFRGRFDLGVDFLYGLFDAKSEEYLGGAGLHPRSSPGALEIGYWLAEKRWGIGLGTEAAAALTQVGFSVMSARRMEIRVAEDNARSRAIPQKLGYVEEGTLRAVASNADESDRDLVVYGMIRAELDGSPAARTPIRIERF